MKIKSAKSAQGTQASQGFGAGKAASQGSDNAGLNLGQEFKGIMERFAGGLNQPGAEISLDTFQVDPLAYAAKVTTQPTEVQTAMQASALAPSSQADLADLPQRQNAQEQSSERDTAAMTDAVPTMQGETEQTLVDKERVQNASSNQSANDQADRSTVFSEDVGSIEEDTIAQNQSPVLEQTLSKTASETSKSTEEPLASEALPSAIQAAITTNVSPEAKTAAPIMHSTPTIAGGTESIVAAQPSIESPAAPVADSAPAETHLHEALSQGLAAFEPAEIAPKNQAQANPTIPVLAQLLRQTAIQDMMLSAPLAGQQIAGAANAEYAARSTQVQNTALNTNLINASGAVSASRGASSSEARAQRSLPPALATRTFERVEQTLKEVARSKDGKSISLHLNPSELGQVKVDVTLREGTLHARLAAENPQVAQLLRDRAQELQVMLRKLGLNVDKITVAVHSDGQSFSQLEQNLTGQERQRHSDSGKSPNASELGSGSVPLGDRSITIAGSVLDHWVA